MSADPKHSDLPKLYGYWRSSSSYRVRIALNLKAVPFEYEAINLVRDGGQQHSPEYRAINPLGLVPALAHDGKIITQSLAIIEYIEERFAGAPLLPESISGRARVRSLAQAIACEIQPMNNLGVMQFLKGDFGVDDGGIKTWYRHWVERGFKALEEGLSGSSEAGEYCHGGAPGMAECCLVPQVYNAERFDCDLRPFPQIRRIAANCRKLPPFIAAAPENQPDAPGD